MLYDRIHDLPGDRALSRRELLARGLTDRQLRRAVEEGFLHRLRGGIYCRPTLDAGIETAIRSGGLLTCASELRRLGVWVFEPEPQVHVRLPPHGDIAGRCEGAVRHWRATVVEPDPRTGHVSVLDAVADAVECLPPMAALAVIDSVAHERLATLAEIESAVRTQAARRLVGRSDPDAASGLETFGRERTLAIGFRCRSQVFIEGAGWIDLLVEECVAIETDGDAFHTTVDGRRRDRRRDAIVAATGTAPLRFGYEQLVSASPEFELAVIGAVGAHRSVKNPGAKVARALRLLEERRFTLDS